MTAEIASLIGTLITALGGAAIAYFQWRSKRKADEAAADEAQRREAESMAQVQRDATELQRHMAIVGRLDRIESGQDAMRDEIRLLHRRDGEIAIELERRAARIEGHLGLHGRPREQESDNRE